ncbi:hypothetical protein [Clostridium baratii]|uniref:Uncharacterized protein n=1 Tax=Clostridium baratii TaxID=1561 RepID=A0A174QXV4_9CLOT|nr:hypothetical protein [Clostridium baratii]CUP74999.1 Uncharacterised protein [Clostridium baratii]
MEKKEEILFNDYADQEYIDFLESEDGLAYIKVMDGQYGYLNYKPFNAIDNFVKAI